MNNNNQDISKIFFDNRFSDGGGQPQGYWTISVDKFLNGEV